MILKTSIAILMFCEAFMLYLLGYDAVVPTLVVIAATYLYFRPIELDVSLSTKILVPTILIGYFFFRYVGVPELTVRSEWVFPSRITISLAECFLFGQIFELIKKRDPEDGLLNFCLLAMAVVVCCCCRNASGSERSLLFIGSVICITLICTIFQYSTRTFVSADATSGKRNHAYRVTLVSATMGLIGISSWYLSGSLQNNIEEFQNWWIQNFQVAGLSRASTSIGFSEHATLQNITMLKNSDPRNPALHIYADSPPGYLRGRAYDFFNGSQWKHSNSLRKSIKSSSPPDTIENRRDDYFKVLEPEIGQNQQVRINNQMTMQYYFLPLNSSYVSGQSVNPQRRIRLDVDSVVLNGISANVSYSGYVARDTPTVELSGNQKERLLRIPKSLDSRVLDIARGVATGQTDREKMASIELYFNDNFQYSLKQTEFPSDRDQLSYFVLEKPKAHCEFFATAAVIFLRANGIPARYVTGFATIERSTEEEYYIARNKDAHAWVEAYDRDSKTWVIVEATPGTQLPKSIWAQDSEDDSDTGVDGGQAEEMESRSRWSSIITQMWIQVREFFEEIGRQLRGPINIAIVSVLLFFLFYHYWWKQRKNTYFMSRDGMLERERIKVEKLLAKLKLRRLENETMKQFEERLLSECEQPLIEKISSILDWFRDYERSRFSPIGEADEIPLAPAIKF